MLAGAVGGAVFVTALLVTVIVPHAADRAATTPPWPIRIRPDTIAIQRRVGDAQEAARRADAALAAAVAAQARDRRAAAHRPRSRADSLADGIATLDHLDSLLDRAPLPSSYRALAAAWPVRGDPRVQALVDSLDHVEHRRAAPAADGAGVDSSYVALTARAAAVGRALRAIARARRAALARELGAAGATAVERGAGTAALRRRSDSVHAVLASARRWLTQARAVDVEQDVRAARERASAARAAAIPAALVASVVVGIVIGFAVAFAAEVRDPCVADVAEAEALVGAPVVARISRRRATPPRRRAVDREVPPLIEVQGGAYDSLHDRVAERAFDLGLLAVTGDDPAATALVAVNLAATAARRVRSTIVVDADLAGGSATRVARSRSAPGLADVLAGRAEWAAATIDVIVGRGRTMELLPSGAADDGAKAPADAAADPTPLLLQLRRRYDAVVVSAPRGGRVDAGAIARHADGTLLVVCTARTPTAALSSLVALLRTSGARIQGIVLWEGELPPVSAGDAGHGLELSVTGTEPGR